MSCSHAAQLEATITPTETRQLTLTPTENLPAYTEYLKGRRLAESESVESLTASVLHFEKAIEFDPEFALAHERLRQLIHDDLEAQASRTEQLHASGDLKF